MQETLLRDVALSGFTIATQGYITAKYARVFSEQLLWRAGLTPGGETEIPLPRAAALFFILRATDEDEFPGGKWATIQAVGR